MKKSSNNPKQIFLIDSFGACITTLLLFFVLRKYPAVFGVPEAILEVFISLAFFLFLYSFFCFFAAEARIKLFLKLLIGFNLIYCLLTCMLISVHFSQIEWIGIAYFAGEISVILVLVSQELKLLRAAN